MSVPPPDLRLSPRHRRFARLLLRWPIMALFTLLIAPVSAVALMTETPDTYFGAQFDYIPAMWQPWVGGVLIALWLGALRWPLVGGVALVMCYWPLRCIDAILAVNSVGIWTNVVIALLTYLEVRYFTAVRIVGLNVIGRALYGDPDGRD